MNRFKILQVLIRWLIYPATIVEGIVGTLSMGYVTLDWGLQMAKQYSRYTVEHDLAFLPSITRRFR